MTLENAIWMVVLLGLTWFLGTTFMPKQKGRLTYVLLVMVALMIKFVLVFIMYRGGTEASGTDGLIYHEVAKDVARQLREGVPIWAVSYKYTWYTVLLGVQYFFFGINRYAASFMNAFLSVGAGFLLMKIGLNLKFSFRKSSLISLAYLFMPSMTVWTTDSRKESLTFFIAIVIWYITLKLFKEREWSYFKIGLSIAAVCILLWISTLLRIYMLYTLGGGILVGLLFHYLKTKRKVAIVFGMAVLSVCLLVTCTTVLNNMQDYHALPLDRSQGGDEDIDDEVGSILKVIMSKDIPASITGFLTKPQLNKVSTISDISGNVAAVTLVQLEMLLWYLCMIFAIFGAIEAVMKWNPYLIGIMAFILTYTLINALVSENVGATYYRYRAAIVAPMLLFIDFRPFFRTVRRIITNKSIES